MKHLLALALSFFVSLAHADSRVDNMIAQCEKVMQAGVCRVALDPKDYPNATILVAGVGRINTAEYLSVRALGEARNPDGTYKMCTVVRIKCGADWESDGCKTARALWKQVAP